MQDQGPAGKSTTSLARQRESFLAAILAVSGELGYRRATVTRVAAHAGSSLDQFYLHFENRAECFAVAYAERADALADAILGAGQAAPSWREGVRAALGELIVFCTSHPTLARALLNEVYVAEGRALAHHQEVLERLSRAVDGACRETDPPRHSPPPITAAFMVGAVEGSVRRRLAEGRGRDLWDDLPELMALFAAPYLGDEAAAEERRRPASPPRDDSTGAAGGEPGEERGSL